ncbi:MAG: non-canonical purine NTP pyrophosphatase [Geobacter sp.]|nr:MAG: non-canonical purine NTP pyrophosphatase [Geobacter sp.]
MKELMVATRNRGKLLEIEAVLAGVVEKVLCASDFPNLPETNEDGTTFSENALKKAREAMLFTGLPTIADDSGLVVRALDERPGVFSARFAGESADDVANNRKLLAEMVGTPPEQRQAAFVCVMAFVTPDGVEQIFSGSVSGRILDRERGTGGFGYDPLFLVDGFERTMAELTLAEKNCISHRGQALRLFRAYLDKIRL